MRSFTYMLCGVIALGLLGTVVLSGGFVQSAVGQEPGDVKEGALTIEELAYYYGKLKQEYSLIEIFVEDQIKADKSYAEVGTMLTESKTTTRQTDLRAQILQRRIDMTTPQKVRDYFDALATPEG